MMKELYYTTYCGKISKISKADISNWLNEYEIYNVNLDNAFDLLASFEGGATNNDTLEFGIEAFRKYSASASTVLAELKKYVEQHRELAINTFDRIWDSRAIEPCIKLFISYIVDERMRTFGDRWMAEGQIESIKHWENKNTLDSTLSSNYGSCLEFFVQNNLVYASGWTSYGNVKEYSLRSSLCNFLFNCPKAIAEDLQSVKESYHYDLPF